MTVANQKNSVLYDGAERFSAFLHNSSEDCAFFSVCGVRKTRYFLIVTSDDDIILCV